MLKTCFATHGPLSIARFSGVMVVGLLPMSATAETIWDAELADNKIDSIFTVHRVGINKTPPSSQLDVGGTVTAFGFVGNGSQLTKLVDNVELMAAIEQKLSTKLDRTGGFLAGNFVLMKRPQETVFQVDDNGAIKFPAIDLGTLVGGCDLRLDKDHTVTCDTSITPVSDAEAFKLHHIGRDDANEWSKYELALAQIETVKYLGAPVSEIASSFTAYTTWKNAPEASHDTIAAGIRSAAFASLQLGTEPGTGSGGLSARAWGDYANTVADAALTQTYSILSARALGLLGGSATLGNNADTAENAAKSVAIAAGSSTAKLLPSQPNSVVIGANSPLASITVQAGTELLPGSVAVGRSVASGAGSVALGRAETAAGAINAIAIGAGDTPTSSTLPNSVVIGANSASASIVIAGGDVGALGARGTDITFNADLLPYVAAAPNDDPISLGTRMRRFYDLFLSPRSLHIGEGDNEARIGYDLASKYLLIDSAAGVNFTAEALKGCGVEDGLLQQGQTYAFRMLFVDQDGNLGCKWKSSIVSDLTTVVLASAVPLAVSEIRSKLTELAEIQAKKNEALAAIKGQEEESVGLLDEQRKGTIAVIEKKKVDGLSELGLSETSGVATIDAATKTGVTTIAAATTAASATLAGLVATGKTKGDAGDTGPAGPAGPRGAPGATGKGIQSATIEDGTLVLIQDDAAHTRIAAGRVQGAKGDTGAAGLVGPAGPAGVSGSGIGAAVIEAGNLVLIRDDAAQTRIPVGNVQGPRGEPGLSVQIETTEIPAEQGQGCVAGGTRLTITAGGATKTTTVCNGLPAPVDLRAIANAHQSVLDVLQLPPSDRPTEPSNGMIYFDRTEKKFYAYADGWQEFAFVGSGTRPGAGAATSGASKLVFVSSQTYTGDLGGVVGADQKCQKLATAAGRGGVFKAWISDSTTNPSARFLRSSVPYVRTDGFRLASNWSDLTSGQLNGVLDRDEYGDGVPHSSELHVWTDTGEDGQRSAHIEGDPENVTCNDWTTAESSDTFGGAATIGASHWSQDELHICGARLRLFCFEQ